jgi:hypothetical protein
MDKKILVSIKELLWSTSIMTLIILTPEMGNCNIWSSFKHDVKKVGHDIEESGQLNNKILVTETKKVATAVAKHPGTAVGTVVGGVVGGAMGVAGGPGGIAVGAGIGAEVGAMAGEVIQVDITKHPDF